jgi:hypothetical protein
VQENALSLIAEAGQLEARTSALLHIGEGLMSHWKSSGLAIFAVACLVGETASSAQAQCDPTIPFNSCATEWSGSSVVNLGVPPGSTGSFANSINKAGQAVGTSVGVGIDATEWSGGSVINLRALPGFTGSTATGINKAGQVVGGSFDIIGNGFAATEWSGSSVMSLEGLPAPRGAMPTASTTPGRS